MKIPENVEKYELRTSTLWFDDEGILYSIPKKSFAPLQTLNEVKIEMDKLKEISGPEKVCMIAESDSSVPAPSKEQRDFISGSMGDIVKAMAIVTKSPAAKMISNLFFGLKTPPYPARVFTDENSAKEWIKQYLK